jgi:beta-glucanase (GH16 family)
MLSRTIIALATAVGFVNAACNPLTSGSCPADPALAASFKEDFTSESKHFLVVNPKGVSFTDDGLELTIAERFDNPSLKSNFYIMFGKVEVVLQAAPGQGIISSFYLQSDDLDEIDIELFGTDTTQFQSNFFAKGYTGNYDRGQYIATSSSPVSNFHTYTLEWTESSLTWSLDGNVVRTLESTDAKGFPQLPMYIMMGSWAGGDPTNPPGTIEWAGGVTDYSKAPFSMYIKSVIVADYSTGSEYSYGDNTGSWQSIQAKDGAVNGRQEQADKEFAALQGGQIISSAKPQSSTTGSATSSSSTVTTSTSSASSATSVTSRTPARTLAAYSSSSLTTVTSTSTTYTSSAEVTSRESFVSTSTLPLTTQKPLDSSSSTQSSLPRTSASGSSTLTTSIVSSATASPTVAFASVNGAQTNQSQTFIGFIFALCAIYFL